MPRTYRQYLEDLLEAAQKIARFVEQSTFEEFEANDMMIGAVLHYLLVIGRSCQARP